MERIGPVGAPAIDTLSVPIVISEAGLVDQRQSTGIRLALPYWMSASYWFFNAVM